MRRAAHQLLDTPLIFEDPFALRILPEDAAAGLLGPGGREEHPIARGLRAFMAARSRFAEDQGAEAIGRGVRQYVLLGAGLDTFAWRNPHERHGVRIFEVDHPATQAWKRELMRRAKLPEPAMTTYVPVDFEHQRLAECLAEAGFSVAAPAFFSWLGVVPYLTLEAFRSTLDFLGNMAAGSGIVFDYGRPREALGVSERLMLDWLAARVRDAGESFQLLLEPEDIESELARVGWKVVADLDGAAIRERYFSNRQDGLEVRGSAGRIVSAGN